VFWRALVEIMANCGVCSGQAAGWINEGFWFRSPLVQGFFCFRYDPDQVWGPPNVLFGYPFGAAARKAAGGSSWPPTPTSPRFEVKNEWRSATVVTCLHVVQNDSLAFAHGCWAKVRMDICGEVVTFKPNRGGRRITLRRILAKGVVRINRAS
jgi:hypothetical protein